MSLLLQTIRHCDLRQDEFIQRIAIFILNSLVCRVDNHEKLLVGDEGAVKVSKLVLRTIYGSTFRTMLYFSDYVIIVRLCYTFQTMFYFSDYVLVFRLCSTFQTTLYVSDYALLFRLCFTFQTMLYFSDYVLRFRLCSTFQTMFYFSDYAVADKE